MRFQLIDRVIEQSADRILAVKNVSAAEEYLADHFPTFPVLPGVMMLEALVQAGRLLLTDRVAPPGAPGASPPEGGAADRPLILAEVRNVRYGNMVRPGEALMVEVTLRGEVSDANAALSYDMQGVGKVNDQVAVQGRFRLAPLVA